MKLDALIQFYNEFTPASVERFPEFYSADAWFKACRYTQVAQQRVSNFGDSPKLLICIGSAKAESKKFRLVSC